MNKPAPFPRWTDSGRRRLQKVSKTQEYVPTVRDLSFVDYAAATNGDTSVLDLVRPIVVGDDCLIVTGYQDFLSTLSIIMELRPGITHEPPDTIRILFGTNTDNLRAHTGPRQPLPEHARRYYTSQNGVFARDMRDLKAVQAIDAIRSGAIRIRVFDEDKASADLGRAPGMMHANLFVNNEFAVAGSANFSRRGMSNNVEFNDRVVSGGDEVGEGPDPHEERRRAGEAFWSWGRDWSADAEEILGKLLRNVDVDRAVMRVLEGLGDFAPWRPVSASMTQRDEDTVYSAARTLYEHGAACVRADGPASRVKIGRSLTAITADMYERMVLRDDDTQARRQGSVAIVSPLEMEAWRLGRRGALRIISGEESTREARDEVENSAVVVFGEGEIDTPRHLAHPRGPDALTSLKGGFAVAMEGEDDAFGGLGICLRLLEDAAALRIDEGAMREISAALDAQMLGRSGKRPKRSHAKLKSSIADGAAQLSALLCGASGRRGNPKIEIVSIAATDGQRAALAKLGDVLNEHEGGDADQVLRRVISGVCTSVNELRESWAGGLGDEARSLCASGGSATQQGQLPMFAEPAEDGDASLVDALDEIIGAKSLARLDATRAEVVAGLAGSSGRLVAVVERQSQVLAVAESISSAGGVRTFAFTRGCPGGGEGAGEQVVAAGEAVADRVRHVTSLTGLRDILAAEKQAVVVLSLDILRQAELRGAEGLVIPAPLPRIGDYFSIIRAAQRATESGQATIHCLETEGLPSLTAAKLKARLADAHSVAGEDGRISPSATAIARIFEHLGDVMSSLDDHAEPIERLDALLAASAPEGAEVADGERSWGADVARLTGTGVSFTAYFLTGKTGRRGEAFMPPRLVLVRHGEEGSEIVRGQEACLSMLEGALRAHREQASPAGQGVKAAVDTDVLSAISGELSEITHWDIRPERVRVPVRSLAEFIQGRRLDCDGASILGDLSLPSLEMLADRWVSTLGREWCELKTQALARQADTGQVPEIVDIATVEAAFRKKPAWETDRLRQTMTDLVEELRFADREKSKTVQDRVAVIIRATP